MLDSRLLADVYIELTGGRQAGLSLETQPDPAAGSNENNTSGTVTDNQPRIRVRQLASRLSEEELTAHAKMLEELGEDAIWRKWNPGSPDRKQSSD